MKGLIDVLKNIAPVYEERAPDPNLGVVPSAYFVFSLSGVDWAPEESGSKGGALLRFEVYYVFFPPEGKSIISATTNTVRNVCNELFANYPLKDEDGREYIFYGLRTEDLTAQFLSQGFIGPLQRVILFVIELLEPSLFQAI